MAALSDPRLEAFAQNLALGLDIHIAHEKAGYAKDASRSNSSKAAKKQVVVDRVAEIRTEIEAQRRLARGEVGELTAKQLVGHAVGMAMAQSDPQVLASIAKFLDDGTLGMDAARKPLALGEILKLARELDGSGHLYFCCLVLLMLVDAETGRPLPPWTDGHGQPIAPYMGTDGRLVLE